MATAEKEPSAPDDEGEASPKPKNPSTGEPSAAYGEGATDPSGPADKKEDPSQQPS